MFCSSVKTNFALPWKCKRNCNWVFLFFKMLLFWVPGYRYGIGIVIVCLMKLKKQNNQTHLSLSSKMPTWQTHNMTIRQQNDSQKWMNLIPCTQKDVTHFQGKAKLVFTEEQNTHWSSFSITRQCTFVRTTFFDESMECPTTTTTTQK